MEKMEFATKARRIVLCMMLMGLLCFVTACGSSDADRMEGTTAGTPSTESTAARETKETDGDRKDDETGGVLEDMIDDVGDDMKKAVDAMSRSFMLLRPLLLFLLLPLSGSSFPSADRPTLPSAPDCL